MKKMNPSLFAVTFIGIFALSSCQWMESAAADNFASISISYIPLEEDDTIASSEWMLSLEGIGSAASFEDTDLTLLDMFHYAAQDEYLARAEYALIMETYGDINPYMNIEKSERQHLALLESLFDLYDQEFPLDPSEGDVVVPSSLLEAAEIGVEAEILNIAMYVYFMEQDIPENASLVFQALKNASEHHLVAFQRQVDKYE